LCRRGKAGEALACLHAIMGKLKLEVNAEKTRICKMPDGTFDSWLRPSTEVACLENCLSRDACFPIPKRPI